MIFSCSMISHYMADLQEITEIANYKLESGLHDQEIVACQKSVSPPSITKEETTTASAVVYSRVELSRQGSRNCFHFLAANEE